ncbi:death-inducer obliterator 1 [Clarias magur]|uniref:Death-inducer obliterator 1 n=1 Tax=Clarias magur TaxID=1594786 RepID=A0A8J4U5E1_CLAMG|nr:death-inducer obliterator 1 [Clarias magur]
MDDPSSKEKAKTWGFRRSTIARREFIEEIGNLDLVTLAPRRAARQCPRGRGRGRGRGKQASETTSNPAKRARGGRRAVKASHEPEPDSEVLQTASHPPKTTSDTEASDSDELTLRELQERARKRQISESEGSKGSPGTVDLTTETINDDDDDDDRSCNLLQSEESVSSLFDRLATSSLENWKSDRGNQLEEDEERDEEQNDADESSDAGGEYSDPNAVYCICRQKHNNRRVPHRCSMFMICCDRCHEWFHGDCVGISQARGRLLEKNGEDYICPSCSPCQSPISVMQPQPALSKPALSSSSESLFTSSAGEERPSEDEGIKGKIRKSSGRSIKRRIKIFQRVEIVEETPEPIHQAVVMEQDMSEGAVKEWKDTVEKVKEKPAVPKCIGPGCSNDALPESVYCGHQCIIRHAAVAMHGLSEPKEQPEVKTKPAPKPTLKIHNLGKLLKKKSAKKPAEDADGGCKEMGSTPAASPTPDPVHKPMGEQQPAPAAIASSQFYRATSTISEKVPAESKPATPVTTPTETPNLSVPSEAPAAEETDEKPAPLVPTASLAPLAPLVSSAPLLKKPNPLPSRAKKTMPGSPRLSASRQLHSDTPQANKSVFTVPNKPCQSQEASNISQASNSTPEVRVLPVTPAPVPPPRPLQPHPNMQMRQNIRRSLTDTLLKRVNDSDDLEISESNVEKLAVNIEREMFNMYYTTDNKYKIKYRSLLLSLKDPKNKGLFYQVVKGHITPFKLTRLSDQELLSVQESTADPVTMKEEGSPVCIDMEQPLSVPENKVGKTDSVATSSLEGKMSLAQVRQAQSKKPSPAVSDIISSMLKDTTAEHKAHLFDLKCRICTGQIFVDEEPDAKTLKKDEQMNQQEEKPPCAVPLSEKKPPSATLGDNDVHVMESPASPTTEDCSIEITQPDFAPPVIPAVSIVTITRRDPRTAGYRSAPPPPSSSSSSSSSSSVVPAPVPEPVPAPVPVPDPPKNLTTISGDKEADVEIKAVEPLQPPAPPPPMPKSILMKPSASSISRFYSSPSLTTRLTSSRASTENDTSHFLSKQDTIWKGFLNMQLVAKFVTKGCLISGSAEVLKKDLPDTIHIGGRILPQTVWEYVERVKTSLTKEMSLIRFYPASDEEEVAYVSLFSYFNSRRRFGVVSNICNNIKDLYLIPLCTNESIPSVLLPIDGPGLEQNHPSLLIGLAVCQKLKRPGPQAQEIDEKRPRIQTPQDSDVMSLPTKPAVPDAKHDKPYDPEITISTTPPDSPPSLRSPDSTSSSLNPLPGTSVLSDLHALLTPPTSSSTDVAKTSVPTLCVPPSTTATPLQTILNTIFGKQKQSSDFAVNTSETTSTAVKEPAIPFLNADPIVQQYQQTPKATLELDDNDRPYDPEEEYDPALGYQNLAPSKPLEISKPNALPAVANEHDVDDERPYDPEEEYNVRNHVDSVHASNTTMCTDTELLLKTSARKDDVAYDPEDDTVFEEMQNYLTDKNKSGTSGSMSLSEQQKMLEDLNRQIEEQKRQLEEQEEALRLQRAAVGVSMAHFSVSDALMSPPPRFGREPDEEMEKTLNALAINLNRDPRQYRHLQQNFVNPTIIGHTDKENVNEKFESSKSNFLASNSLEQDLSKNDNLTLSKLDEISVNADTTVLCSEGNTETNAHQGASALQQGTSSSSGNDNIQRTRSPSKDSGKTRQSQTSRRQHHSSPQRRSRHETRRSCHEKRTSDQSKDDGHRRRGRHSPERTSRRSRSRSRRKERASSREKERYHHRSTSSRQSSRRDRRYSSSRSRSTRRPTSPELENKVSNQNKKSVLRQKDESNTDSTNNVSSEQPEIQSDNSQNEASGKVETKETKIQKTDNVKLETDHSEQREQKTSDPPCVGFSQSKQVNLESNQVDTNPLQREDFHKSSPQSEKLSLQQGRNNESFDTRHQLGNQKGNTLHNNEIDFYYGTDEKSSWLESDCLPQITHKIERKDFLEPDETFSQIPQPQRLPHLRGSTPELIPPQNQKSCFSLDGTLHPRDFISQGAHSVASVGLENDVHRNIHPREQFRLRTPEIKWRGPQHRMDGPRGPTLMQPRIPRAPHPEGFETYRPLGPRSKRLDDCGPAPNFGPRGPRIFDGPGPQSLRPRCPSPVPRMFEGASRQLSGPEGRFPRPGRFEGFGRQNVGPRDAFSGPDMFDDSVNFAESPQREFDCRLPGIQDCDDSWGSDVPHQVDGDLFSEFRRPRERGAPQRFRENMLKARDSEQDFSDFRDCEPPFDEAEIEHLPCQYSDDQSDYHQTFANERFLNPQEPKSRRNPTPRPAHTRYPIHNQLEGPQFPMRELSLKRPHKFDDFRDQADERETIEQHFAKPEIFESSGDSERAAQIKGPRINPPQNLRGPRAPNPQFCDKRMLSSRNTQLLEDKPSSSHFSLPSTSKSLRPLLPRSRLSGRTKETAIRPLRLSGPLLPTPPGGPIKFHNPRMQRPNLPQRPLARRHMGDLAKPAMMSGSFDDDLNNHDAETYVGFIEEEFIDREEEYSGQDNIPGKPWCREARRRNSTARRGHSSE